MRIMTILGTRPEFIRLSLIIKKLDLVLNDEHIIINTNQNFDDNLSNVFLNSMYEKDFKCDYNLGLHGSFSSQMALLFTQLEMIIKKEKPDRFFVLGDTNSSMGGIIAKRLGVRVFHLEAGNRCYWDKTPEEVNRRLIDHSSDILMTYSDNSKRILLNEGFKENQVFCVGNPIYEVMNHFKDQIDKSLILDKIGIYSSEYSLCTLHRSENIDDENRLRLFLHVLSDISIGYNRKIVLIVHPHLNKSLKGLNIDINLSNIITIDPIGFFDFVKLEKNADLVFTDSGTVQEECQILNKKCIVLRESSERWETIENGSCIVTGCNEDNIQNSFKYLKECENMDYDIIDSYRSLNVSDRVVKILLGNHRFIGA